VNRLQLIKALGDGATAEAIAERIAEVEQLVRSTAGLSDARGDMIKVTAVDFIDQTELLAPVEGEGLGAKLFSHLGSFINASALVVVVLLVLFLGLRPALRQILPIASITTNPGPGQLPDLVAMASLPIGAGMIDGRNDGGNGTMPQIGMTGRDPMLDDLARQVSHGPRDRLAKIVEMDPDRAVEVLRQWLGDAEGSRA
jgi:flagellar M-ring protein FliF